MSLIRRLFGRPLRTDQQHTEQLGVAAGVPVLGLDALASAAYGPEAALTVLIVAGPAASGALVPVVVAIVVVLALVYFSYLQTIEAYPNGGGSYTVAKENLGARWGIVAAAALCTDYVLNAAVAIAAGVGAVVSVVPSLLPHTLLLCLVILTLLACINLRGVRAAGIAFSAPTYAFVALLGAAIVAGLLGVRRGSLPTPPLRAGADFVSAWLILRAFASGCTALTGVEAVSNGVPLFSEPHVGHARRTLTAIVTILAGLLLGIGWLARSLHLQATTPGEPGYQSVLSMITTAVFGRGPLYAATMTAVLLVLCLSANTSFADFPRVCRLLADDGYLPRTFATRGARLVYTQGIVVLTVLSAALLVAFGGITDALIPLFAVGAFSAFTLSQAGMVRHWQRAGTSHASMWLNAAGALATGATLAVIIVAKFVEGAWMTLVIIPCGYGFFLYTQRVHRRVEAQITPTQPIDATTIRPPVAVVSVDRIDRAAMKAVRFAASITTTVHGVLVATEGSDPERVQHDWQVLIERPICGAGRPKPQLLVVPSPYRRIVKPLIRTVRQLADQHPGRTIAVIIPELIEPHWHQMWLHSQRATLLRFALLLHGTPGIVVVNTPWYVRDEPLPAGRQ
jgi:amino acid transporter